MSYVFISYDRNDLTAAESIGSVLASEGIPFLLDQSLRDESRAPEIEDKVRQSACVLWLISHRSNANPYVQAEAKLGGDLRKLVPVMIEKGVPTPTPFNVIQSLLATEGMSEREKEVIVSSVRRYIGHTGHHRAQFYPKLVRARTQRIFVSHSNVDKMRISPAVRTLAGCGFRLWIDRPQEMGFTAKEMKAIRITNISYGGDWQSEIAKAVAACTIVLAFWSKEMIERSSEQLQYELFLGLTHRKLFQCVVEDLSDRSIPAPYKFLQIADLTRFSPLHRSESFELLATQMARHKGKSWF